MSPLWFVLALLPLLGNGERFSCRGRILGAYYADAKSGCKAFHVCVRVAGGGVRDFRFFCPPGTLFHQEAQTCTDWGDDDPLACPADIYDGQFDLYKIGSGFDTKKLSTSNNNEEESEFGLQRAETGDRRNQHVSSSSSSPASDLRAAHSSDFFSGQRDRGRDEAPVVQQSPPARQSFRRTSPRVAPTSPPPTSAQPTSPPLPSSPAEYEVTKRKIVRKRPIYVSPSTLAPTTFTENYPTQSKQSFPEQGPNQYIRKPLNRQRQPTSPAVQYNEEYVEVSRVTPKVSKYYSSTNSPTTYHQQQSAIPQFTKKDGLTELYNYDAQSLSSFNGPKDNRPIKATLRNSFSVSSPIPRDYENVTPRKHIEINTNGERRNSSPEYVNEARNFGSSTSNYRNQNSVSQEAEKNNFISYSGDKHNFVQQQAQKPTTAAYATTHVDPRNLNTVAYKTNIGFDARPANYAHNDEDDGQYRLPAGEDDGQYRPELYERELLSGAHSLNIAASGNRLPDDQKPRPKPHAKPVSYTSSPRPFSSPVSSSQPPRPSSETTFSTTLRPQPSTNNQRTFDYVQTYTTTSRPKETPAQNTPNYFAPINPVTYKPSTTPKPYSPETKKPSTQTPVQVSSIVPKKPTIHKKPIFSQPASAKEDNSYDYAYYDSDSGFSEYEQIEEFGKTKAKS